MNILIFNHYAGSPDMGMAFRPYYLAQEWLKMGHQVRIVAADYSHLRVKNPTVHTDFQEDIISGIHYCWVKTGHYSKNGTKRALAMFRFAWKLWFHAKKLSRQWEPDIILDGSTYHFDTYAAQKISRITGAKLIHEVRDMWPCTLIELGHMKKYNPFVLLVQHAENSFCRHADYVVSLLSDSKQYLIEHGMDPKKFHMSSNGVVLQEWYNTDSLPQSHQDILNDLHNENKFVIGYFGGHALSNALDTLLDAARQTKDSSIVFVLVGAGLEKERLMLRKTRESINNLFFLPPIPKKSIPSLLKEFDCIYIGSAASPLYRFGVCMNKCFDSMMSAKPIICSITAPSTVVTQYNCGIQVDSEDVPGIVKAAQTLKNMSTCERNVLGENGRKAIIEHFTYEKIAADYAALF